MVAENVAEIQAAHFLEHRRRQLEEVNALGFDPIVTVPFDAELFGHWWFEGPRFLEFFIRKAADEQDIRLTTPGRISRGESNAANNSSRRHRPGARMVILKSGSIRLMRGFIRNCTRRRDR